ncbi:MAG: LysR family transcriptional regulator, partial [Corynebacterium sp.]|nr:LysR family transcriptional regulator [Corynebacterium sp.]
MLMPQLTYFEALAREQHFGHAAASCYVSTSTLSEAIRKLEAEVGFPLVNRGKSAFQGITQEGEIVLAYARRILSEQRSLSLDLAHRRGNLEGTVRFGTIPSGTDRAAGIVSNLVGEHPALRVDLVAGLTSFLFSTVMKADTALFNSPPSFHNIRIPGLADIPVFGPIFF